MTNQGNSSATVENQSIRIKTYDCASVAFEIVEMAESIRDKVLRPASQENDNNVKDSVCIEDDIDNLSFFLSKTARLLEEVRDRLGN